MEVLNRNRRNRSIWRLVLLGGVVLALLIAGLYSSHRQYENQGMVPLAECQKKLQNVKRQLDGRSTDWKNTESALRDTIRQLRVEASKPDAALERLTFKIEDLQKEVRDLKEEKQELRAVKNQLENRLDNLTKDK